MDEAGRDHQGSPSPTPCSCRVPSVQNSGLCLADDRLGPGTGMGTALEVAVKAVRALRPSWNVPEAVVSFKEGLQPQISLS